MDYIMTLCTYVSFLPGCPSKVFLSPFQASLWKSLEPSIPQFPISHHFWSQCFPQCDSEAFPHVFLPTSVRQKDPIWRHLWNFQPPGALPVVFLTTATSLLKTTDGNAALSHANNMTQRKLYNWAFINARRLAPVFLGYGEEKFIPTI